VWLLVAVGHASRDTYQSCMPMSIVGVGAAAGGGDWFLLWQGGGAGWLDACSPLSNVSHGRHAACHVVAEAGTC